ncbi:MAG TPA: serine hydrolase domain-containing protein [Flavitalea sp.]|nr:serine hydrolase domain-containing protein [Flavitalea sp.]
MKTNLLFILLLITFFNAESQQKLTEAAPETQKFSRERLQRIDNMIKKYIDDGKVNGATALIARNGKIVYYRGFGFDDKENKKPMKRDAIFRIASQTKAITSTAVMMLYEEGKFLLDDPISKYIHSFKNPQVLDKFNEADSTYTTVPAKREVTVRDLLTHTSGIAYAQIGSPESNAIYAKNNIRSFYGQGSRSLAEDIQKLGTLPLMHHPGEKFTYGLNTDVLGYLVEVVSEMPLDDFFRKKIFEPLGMKDTYFYIPADKQNRLVTTYYPDSTGKLLKLPDEYNDNGQIKINFPKTNSTYFSGGAGLSSTVYDYAIFLQMILNGGEYDGKRILSRNTVRMMTMNQLGNITIDDNNAFGLGFSVVTNDSSGKDPSQSGTFSWGGIYSTDYWADPKEKIVGLIFKQMWNDPASESNRKFRVMTYAALTD